MVAAAKSGSVAAGALLGDIVGDSIGVRSHIPLDRWRQGLRHAGQIVVRATCHTEKNE